MWPVGELPGWWVPICCYGRLGGRCARLLGSVTGRADARARVGGEQARSGGSAVVVAVGTVVRGVVGVVDGAGGAGQV
eukprot:1009856-Heterocapsa_arctica.AAC.1